MAMTGLSQGEFLILLGPFTDAWREYTEIKAKDYKDRKRSPGGGRDEKLLRPEDKLLFILYYCKAYPLQEVLALEFGMSQSQACVWVHVLSDVLQLTLRRMGHTPERVPERLAELIRQKGEGVVVVDGTERRRQRPKDDTEQLRYYSGKKKAHTFKNVIIVTQGSKIVLYVSDTYEGKKHDKKVCDEEGPTFPNGVVLFQDTGFQGYAPAEVLICQPKKKTKGKELTDAEKEQNRLIARFRIVVEHVISSIKRLRIVKEVFRNWKHHFEDLVMEIACGLHNFRTVWRYKGIPFPSGEM